MSKAVYISDNNENRKCPTLYAVIGKENRKIKRGYVTVDNEWRMCYLSAWIWDVWNSVGTTTWNKYNSVETTTYYWNRYGTTQEYGEWMLEYIEPINTTWSYSDYTNQYFYNKLSAAERYNNKTYGDMDIASSAEGRSGLQMNVSDYQNNTIGYSVINGEKTTVYGWVNTGANAAGYYRSYFDNSNYIDVITSVYYNSSTDVWTIYGSRYRKYWIRDAWDVQDTAKKYSDVSSTNRSAYPNDGKSGSYWYIFSKSALSYSRGSTSYGSVTSASSTTYPANGRYAPDGLWYVSQGTTYEKGDTYYGEVESEVETAYPENGRHTDGRWYVRKP